MTGLLQPLLDLAADGLFAAFIVFWRVGAAMAALPAFGEQTLPQRVRLAMALAFAQGGAQVAVMGRSIEKAEEGAAKIAALGTKVHAMSCDGRLPEQVTAAFDEAEQVLGPVSLLANNAGANFPVLAEDISVNAWNAVTRIAIDGTFLCSTEFARRRIARGQGGAIINNSAK